ncbi:hypothetical protein HUA78_33440 [Myxococcus sp. CA033]|uniref:hypothetical protein n=1 Tax=Myxococcus sp. CA033 TaxID=2741516 RepID=UPI00157BB508|nr:hypothetical protein [Myxococcus sp. CA033]NTX39351.1 hypothetical protein [Myxococcus sp. CA033]
MKGFGCLAVLFGGALKLWSAFWVIALLVAHAHGKIQEPAKMVAAQWGVMVVLPFLLGQFLWKKGRSSQEEREPAHWVTPTVESRDPMAELADFIRSKGDVTVKDVAIFCQVSEEKAEQLILKLIAAGEINRVFEPQKGAYVVSSFTPGRTSAGLLSSAVSRGNVSADASASSENVTVSTRRLEHRCPSCNAPQDLGESSPGDKRVCPYCDIAFLVVAASPGP